MNYKIVYSCRKSLRISVRYNNEIIVGCPKGMPKRDIENFVNSKLGWIESVLAKNSVRLEELNDFYKFESIYLLGKKSALYLGSDKNYIDGDGVHLTDVKDLKKLYTACYKDALLSRVENISKATGLTFKSVSVKDYKSRWGCCNQKGEITFNYKIFMLPERLIDYNIVHELCHTVYFDHSKNFWYLVGKILPDYKSANKELKNYNFVTRLY